MDDRAKARGARMLSSEEVSVFCDQVALILGSGISLRDGLEALIDNYKGTRFYESFERLDERLRESGSLYEATREAGVFPAYLQQMVNIGERTGELDNVMSGLSAYYERESKIRRAIQNAIAYPLVLIAMMAAVIVVLVARVLPIFDQVFKNMGGEMSASATALMNFGAGAGRAVLILSGVVIVGVLLLAALFKTGHRASVMRTLTRFFPPVRRLTRELAAGRFSSVMAMMLSSGFPLEEAVNLLPDVFSDDESRERVRVCRDRIAAGSSFPDAVADTRLFEELHIRMIRVGFMGGKTDAVMQKLAGIYEEEMDDGISRLVSMIEPTLVALLSVIIGAILLSVMLPLASIMSSI